MTDRELLELAAKAAGLKNFRYCPEEDGLHACIEYDDEHDCTVVWMPHLDDGDCARMEAAIGIDVSWSSVYAMADNLQLSDCILAPYSAHNENRQAARRWASTRAAAEIGKAMP